MNTLAYLRVRIDSDMANYSHETLRVIHVYIGRPTVILLFSLIMDSQSKARHVSPLLFLGMLIVGTDANGGYETS